MAKVKIKVRRKGGPGSGHWGHAGIPGRQGGSAPGKGPTPADLSGYTGLSTTDLTARLLDDVSKGKITFDQATSIASTLIKKPSTTPRKISSITEDEAIDNLGLRRDDTKVFLSHLSKLDDRWVRGADLQAKEAIVELYRTRPELKDVRLEVLRSSIAPDVPFAKFINTPITVYRGGTPVYGDTFSSFSIQRSTAEGFAKRTDGALYKLTLLPKDLIGYTAAGEAEVYVPPEFRGQEVRVR